jgi:hypothetical protein
LTFVGLTIVEIVQQAPPPQCRLDPVIVITQVALPPLHQHSNDAEMFVRLALTKPTFPSCICSNLYPFLSTILLFTNSTPSGRSFAVASVTKNVFVSV